MSRTMPGVSFNVSCRPVRLGFLVKPTDTKTLRAVLQANTCVWGGQFNAIVPVSARRQRTWKTSLTAAECVEGYLAAFEPDYLVNCGISIPEGIVFDESRIIPLDSIVLGKVGARSHRLNVFTVYKHLFETEYQFTTRHPRPVFLPRVARSDLLVTATFGQFPASRNTTHLREAYVDAFAPSEPALTPDAFLRAALGYVGPGPLQMGSHGLDVRGGLGIPTDLVVFVVNGSAPGDIIDFWNLRALGWNIIAVDARWRDRIGSTLSKAIEQHNVRFDGRRSVPPEVTLMRSRATDLYAFTTFRNGISIRSGLVIQDWYPRIWDRRMHESDHVRRCSISAGSSERYHPRHDDSVYPKAVGVPFDATVHDEWVNVISFLPSHHTTPSKATVFPTDSPAVARLLGLHDGEHASHEGLVLTGTRYKATHNVNLRDGMDIFRVWLQERGNIVRISSAGRTSREMLRAVGGPSGAGVLASEELVKLLNSMAHGLVEQAGPGAKQKTVARTANHGRLRQCVKTDHHVRALLDCGVLKLGLSLSCSHCEHRNWYQLGAITSRVACERCLREYDFPESQPPGSSAWSYRTQGPFSIADYSQGAYTVALTLRALSSVGGGGSMLTWSPNLELESDRHLLEFDFSCWWRNSINLWDRPELVFGECKSFNRFEKDDVSKMEALVASFPGAYIVFATLRRTLESAEIRHIAKLARKRRAYNRVSLNYSPVIVLTGHELFGNESMPRCWKALGDKVPEIRDAYWTTANLADIAAATQHIHLGIEYVHGPRGRRAADQNS